MYLEQYKIQGTINHDQNPCFNNSNTFPNFQEKLEEFKSLLKVLVAAGESKTFYKFGDGDYFFLKKHLTFSYIMCKLGYQIKGIYNEEVENT